MKASLPIHKVRDQGEGYLTVALPEYFTVTLSLLNLLEKSLGRSKPATKLMQAL